MTEQPQPPEKDSQQPPMKSATPPSPVATSTNQLLQTAIVWITTTAVRLRPTAIGLLGTIAMLSQQGKQQLELQEKNAASQGKTVAPIDWTPVTKLADRFWTTVRPLWQKILVAARPRLPESFQPLDDRALSGIFAGTLLLILWFFSLFSPGQAATPPPAQRSERSPYARTYSKRPPSPQPVTRPSDRQSGNQFGNQYDSQSMPIADLSSPTQTPVRSQPIPQPIAPTIAKPVTAPPIAVTQPAPQSTTAIAPSESLSPEANRRLKLRQNLDLIANALVPQSIVGIRPNDRSQSLTITLNDAWYRSPEDTQTNLSNSLLVIAQGQGYSRLQLEDTEGSVVARNPVVGDGMIVVQRSR
jgi:hypothetical protein